MKLRPLLLSIFLGGWLSPIAAYTFPPVPGERYDIGGYHLHIHCKGEGSPTVIIDVGLGDDSSDWSHIQQLSSEQTRVCVYDRPGYGWSDFGPQPRHSLKIADELKKLLEAAEVSGPYLLVGHSFGGYNMRIFAAQNPDHIAGLLLVDASHEYQHERLSIRLPEHSNRSSNVLIMQKSTTEDVHAGKARALRERAYRAASAEITAMQESARQVQQKSTIPTVPLVVISRGKPEWYGDEHAQNREKTWILLQQDLTRLSPISRHLFANESGHAIPHKQPEVIVQAILELVEMHRLLTAQ